MRVEVSYSSLDQHLDAALVWCWSLFLSKMSRASGNAVICRELIHYETIHLVFDNVSFQDRIFEMLCECGVFVCRNDEDDQQADDEKCCVRTADNDDRILSISTDYKKTSFTFFSDIINVHISTNQPTTVGG